jgi:energy-coupling factor transporter ATP-binding protein EcfA2
MSSLAQIPLESYLLAQQAAPIECLVCKQENCRSATRCRACRAPMALAHQAESVKHKPHLIAVLGASGAGKTTYLGMLMDILTRQVGLPHTTARGPLSISLQQTTATALSTGWFPEKTEHDPEHWHWVHCQFHCRRRRRPIEVVFADVAGDAFARETEHEGRYPAIRAILANCAGVIVLADAERLKAGDHEHDFVTLKLLTLLGDLRDEQLRNRRLRTSERRPLALVLTKADKCDGCIVDPREFAEAHAATLLGSCQTRFPRHQVFGCSVAGATAYRDLYGSPQHVPLRIEPHGIVEPFGWLVTEMG